MGFSGRVILSLLSLTQVDWFLLDEFSAGGSEKHLRNQTRNKLQSPFDLSIALFDTSSCRSNIWRCMSVSLSFHCFLCTIVSLRSRHLTDNCLTNEDKGNEMFPRLMPEFGSTN